MDTTILKYTVICIFTIVLSKKLDAQYATNVTVTDLSNEQINKQMSENATKFLTEINLAFFEDRKPILDKTQFTPTAINSILALWEMSKFRCYETSIIERGISHKNGFEIRNIPVFMKEAKDGENYEEVVVVFNTEGIIDNIYISIGTNRVNEILKQSNSVTDFRRRQIVLDFIENFRTAYNRKDIDFLDKVFSDQALIIIGSVLKPQKKQNEMMMKNLSDEKIRYSRKTKVEYINNLKRTFTNNTYINVKFEDIEVVQHGKYPEIYGVTVKQHWNSSNYSDVGYVFLMIDFRDENNPIIQVRTWQPEKFADGSKIGKDDVFNLGSFGDYNR